MSAVAEPKEGQGAGGRGQEAGNKGPEAAKKAEVDPFMAELAASFNQAIDPESVELKLKPMAPVVLDEPAETLQATKTVGEVVTERARVAEEGKEEEKAPSTNIQAPEKHQTAEKPEETPKEPPKEAAKVEPQVKVKARPVMPAAPAAAPVPVPAPASAKEPEGAKGAVVDEYERGLSDGQREEMDLARAAEKFLPEQYRGQPDKFIGFFKKVDEFANSHPDLSPESEEFKEFVERQRPVYREGDRRRVDRMQIKAEVSESTRLEMEERLAKETGELKRRQHELEEKPLVAKALDSFQENLFEQLPEGADPSLKEVGQLVSAEGFAEAAAKFPVEAPIYESTVHAAHEYLGLVHGLKAFNEQDVTHRWLVSFIDRQAEVVKGDADRRIQKGREFLAPHEFAELAQKDNQVEKKHWTFSERQILDMLAYNAHLSATNRLKELEAAGFKRNAERSNAEHSNGERGTRNAEQGTPKVEVAANAKSEPVKSPEEENGTASPRAGTTGAPGVANGKPNANENAQFLEMLVPGGGKFAA